MGRNHCRFRIWKQSVCVLALIFSAILTGCGNNGSAAAGSENVNREISRAEYIGMLGDVFGYDMYLSETDIFTDVSPANEYYPEIQAAAEWQIIDGSGVFEPDKAATVEFALASAVKAIGTDDIAASGAEIDVNNLAGFYADNIARIDLGDAGAPIDASMAEQIITYAKDYDNGLVLPQITEVEFAEGVKTAVLGIRLNADGKTGLLAGGDYQVGDILYIEATDTSVAKAIKITGIEGEKFTYENAAPEEVFTYLHIEGSFPGNVVEAVSASDGTNVNLGQEIYDEMKSYNMSAEEEGQIIALANSAKVEKGKDSVVFTASFDVQGSKNFSDNEDPITGQAASNGKLVVAIKNIKVNVKYESEWYSVLSPKKIECSVHFDAEVSTEIHGSVGASIPLGEITVQAGGPFSIKMKFTAHLGADGNVSISYTTENVAMVGWKKKAGLNKSFDSKPSLDATVDATLMAEVTTLADLRLFSVSVVNAQVSAGAVAAATVDADLLGDQPVCADVQLYVTAKWGVNQAPCLVTDINGKWKYSAVIFDSTNSPIKLHMHFEDWKRTPDDKCTRKETVKQELTTPEGEPLEEIDPFDFEPLEFDFIELVDYSMYMGEGEAMDIGFESIPEGYTESDLIYEVQDSSVCTVSNGRVQGGSSGSTTVKISTGDGMFTVTLAVTINEDYSIEGFQSL